MRQDLKTTRVGQTGIKNGFYYFKRKDEFYLGTFYNIKN